MKRTILIVDDEIEVLQSLKEGLEKYDETFSILLAEDGEVAVDKLNKNAISLVVTDLRMPRMDGFSLLIHIMTHFPDIPVIIITGFSRPVMERMAKKIGAVGYIEKPFMLDDLAQKITDTLGKKTEGGAFHGVSSAMFAQLVEQEQKTCTIRLENKSSGKQGVLFFREGELFDARINNTQGEAAAREILSWNDITLSIQDECLPKEKKIRAGIALLIDQAMLLKAGQKREKG